jgi:hypothetical protein
VVDLYWTLERRPVMFIMRSYAFFLRLYSASLIYPRSWEPGPSTTPGAKTWAFYPIVVEISGTPENCRGLCKNTQIGVMRVR